ncbi:alpha/beta hydrolase [Nostoc sp. 3335mG]|nr:alpha/beta hydrolase [Nostoc sp. 3335mG]
MCLDESVAAKEATPPTSRAGHRGALYSSPPGACPLPDTKNLGRLRHGGPALRRVPPGVTHPRSVPTMKANMLTPLVLLPGLLCDARLWRDVVLPLRDTVAPMVADLTLDDSVAAMASRTLAAAPPRFALAGLSMGGYVALEVMRQAPDRVTRLALFDTSARPDTDERREARRKGIENVKVGKFIGVSRSLLPSLLAKRNLETPLAEEVQAMAERCGQETYIRQQQAILGRVDSRPDLAGIKVPTLIGVGTEDALTPPELAEEMAAAIPHADITRFAGSGHLPTMENPRAVADALGNWLAR